MPRIHLLASLLVTVLTISPIVADDGVPHTPRPTGAEQTLGVIEQTALQKQAADKELTLRQGAAAVATQRVQELQKQLDEAQKRATAEAQQVTVLQQSTAALDKQLADLKASLPLQEAADQLVLTAAKVSARLDSMMSAETQLQNQLATLRKSSVEWRSKASDADQKIAAIVAQRPELEKKANETKVGLDTVEVTVNAAQVAMTTAQANVDSMNPLLTAQEEQLKAATVSVESLNQSVASLENSLKTLREAAKLTGNDASAAIQGLEKTIADFASIKKNTDTLVTQVTARRDDLVATVAVAKTELEKKTAEQKVAVAAAEPMRAAWKAASDALAAANQQETELKFVKGDGERWQKVLNAQLTGLEPSLQKLQAETQIVSNESFIASHQAEAALEPLGRFVSFSRNVAPILAQRCVACHNTRSPGGRLNLDSFASLLKGGESGEAVSVHKSADSLLVSMIEDGSMPKDADPLSPAEIAIVKQWIDVGAPLDAGVTLTADLFDVMPEQSQPLPPTEYRVAIPVTAVAFSPDGSQLASSGYHEVLVWNTADSTLIRRISNVAERIYDLEYSADGSMLAVAAGTPGQLGELKLFSVADGQLIRTLVRARDAVFALSFSPDGQLLACAGADRSINVVKVADGAEVLKIEDHADWVMDVNWSPNGQRLVTSSRDKTCKVFESATGNPVITFSGHGEPVYSAAFLADSTTVVSGGGDRRLRIWNSGDAKEVRAIGGFGGDVFRIQILPGDLILSACGDRAVHEHKAADGALLRKMEGHQDWVYTLSANPARKLIASGSYDGEIRVWNSEDGSMTTSFIAIPRQNPDQTVAAQK
jgi:predicted  nucleic acid-binding Zn-ribbon protein